MKEYPPDRCVDPVVKNCENCIYGRSVYPNWVSSVVDLLCCDIFETQCSLGYDKGRPEDEPTEKEIKEFNERWGRFKKKRCE